MAKLPPKWIEPVQSMQAAADAVLAASAKVEAVKRAELAELPSYEEMLIKWPIYRRLTLRRSHADWYGDLRGGDFQFDAFCVECQRDAPFKGSKPSNNPISWWESPIEDSAFASFLRCQRDEKHVYTFYFRVKDQVIQKVGQYPSMEDIASSDVEKYRKQLGAAYFSELHRAGGLASFGIGIGAFVYLRRIFERLIYQHRDEFDPDGSKLPEFATMRMEERVLALRSILPPALVKNRATYSILSKGIHELSEDECLKHFPVVRAAIIMMLDQDYQAEEAARLAAALDKEIQDALGAITASRR